MEREFWKGEFITELAPNEVFVFGSNPEARHFAGAAKSALKFGAIPRSGKTNGIARGLSPNKQTYGVITKNLTAGITVDGILYDKEGYLSVSPEQISDNIDELYLCAKEHSDRRFLITYKYESWPNGTPKKSLNGYTSQEMLEMFAKNKEVPPNIVFHESYKPHLEKLYNQKNSVNEVKTIYKKPNVTSETNGFLSKSIVGNKFAKDVNVEGNLLVISPQDNVPEGFNVINTTSRDIEGFGKNFSPFLLKNIPLYGNIVAKNMENAWQYSKVYKKHMDENGNPNSEYFVWAKEGWNAYSASRYPMGKGNKAEYSYWESVDDNGNVKSHKWDYITARKNIYIPLYAKAISQTKAFKELQQRYDDGEKIALWDFDGYNHYAKDMSFESVVHDQKRCGHAFVLYGLLKGYLKIISDELIYDFDLKIQSETPKKINKSVAKKKDNQSTDLKTVVLPNELKNLYPSVYSIMSLNFVSIDHFMAYSKAKNSGDHESARLAMLICEEPFIKALISGDISHQDIATNKEYQREWLSFMNVIKALSTEIQGVDNNIWKSQAPALMKIAMKAKFEQNPNMQDIVKGYIKSLKKEDIDNSIMNQYLRDVSKEISAKRKPKM